MYHKAEWTLQSCYAMKNDMSTVEALLRVTVGETHWVGAIRCFEGNQCLMPQKGSLVDEKKQVQYTELDADEVGKANFLHFVNTMHCS